MSDIELQNFMVTYVVHQHDIPHLGSMKAAIMISERPVLPPEKSIEVAFYSDRDERPTSVLGTTTISYRSMKQEKYCRRIQVSATLPSESLRSRRVPYDAARKALESLIPRIIAEHERMNIRFS